MLHTIRAVENNNTTTTESQKFKLSTMETKKLHYRKS